MAAKRKTHLWVPSREGYPKGGVCSYSADVDLSRLRHVEGGVRKLNDWPQHCKRCVAILALLVYREILEINLVRLG